MIKGDCDFLLVTCYTAKKKRQCNDDICRKSVFEKNNIICGCFTSIELTKGVGLAIISMDIIQV